MNCPLCNKSSFEFYITFCRTHKNIPLIVLTKHRSEFTQEEKEMIKNMFPDRHIRWEMQSILTHAHCHLE